MNPGQYDVPLLLPPAIKDKVPSGIVLHALRVCIYDMAQSFSGRKLGGGFVVDSQPVEVLPVNILFILASLQQIKRALIKIASLKQE